MIDSGFSGGFELAFVLCEVHRTEVAQGEAPEGTVFAGSGVVEGGNGFAGELFEGFEAAAELSLTPSLIGIHCQRILLILIPCNSKIIMKIIMKARIKYLPNPHLSALYTHSLP